MKKLNKKTKNKKAQIDVAIFTLLTIGLLIFSLVVFLQRGRGISQTVLAPYILKEVYYEADMTEFYLKHISETAAIRTFKDFSISYDFINGECSYDGKYYELCKLNENLNNEFRNKFIENFDNERKKYPSDIIGIDKINYAITNNILKVEVKEEIINVSLLNLVFDKKADEIDINYVTDISYILNLSNSGLNSFQNIENIAKGCSDKIALNCQDSSSAISEMENCLVIENFNVDIETCINDKNNFLIKLESKKRFFIDNFEKIKLEFLIG